MENVKPDAGSSPQPHARAFVSGCFDLLHSGHLQFLQQAATYGRLTVAIGSDTTVAMLKGRPPVYAASERAFMLASLRVVDNVIVSSGTGILDFEPELRALRPDVFVVNEDGDHEVKRQLCEELQIRYVVLTRTPHAGLPARSSSELRPQTSIPYRIEIAGGWLDQPDLSRLHPGSVVVASIEPDARFMERSGLASSSHATAARTWGPRLPGHDPVTLARQLFALENPPGTTHVAGSQDQFGICVPGVTCLNYEGRYWPESVETITDEETLTWLETVMFLIQLPPRPINFDVMQGKNVDKAHVSDLSRASAASWQAIKHRNVHQLGRSLTECLSAQVAMFPSMLPPHLAQQVSAISLNVAGAKFTGAGGGGYIIVVSSQIPTNAIRFKIRRPELNV